MKYRTLGKTGLEVSVIGVGAWQFGGEWGKDFTQAEVDQILGRAKDLGINLIDTAECYGDHLSESLIGKALQKNRKDWIIATKFGHKYNGYLERTHQWSPKEILKQLEDSLKALRTDTIDLYQFHTGDDNVFGQEELWAFLKEQAKAGKIRHLGNSVGNDYLHQTKLSEKFGVEVMQVIYNRLETKPETEVFPICKEQRLGVLARMPLASGFLSGKYKPGTVFGNDQRSRFDQKRNFERLKMVEEIKKTEVPEGVNMAQWALAWCLKNSQVTAVIPGCKNLEQLESNAQAAELI
ncbi:MAG: aldo/keto reductase [Deltaproteobacteria bacterium RIFCSPLOWO2_12_FULL_44_12]|nr:MAG: aldo/keto reductase [Deltaproteobacteria bacterium RIFCSPHIGHO2_01_FULL_43_49]OGQ16697.1 MAG: aldo/keto reductase [Deltaproteobacteria bacterium RIFCSPHIGHO2_02_FULL_44_53]OGQ29835.1 MAG: aldo/keto reductase [Deltaproteobacteria bacterium RIFCSPHIGHO2_12_FULL_44_21]OGQ33125.1 MAG: aldo/keto reductase [Deltaproteobacteria bacterium RIFCSPLOWO2_01_FULL_45_74]OGQ42220.1 MAG: aldo/keto reductase [Deltaproteobacteria bacterium RIFCSPLOWO2_02_FULL_44_34]OGQ70618.1 MAG: aldo/keto reductase [D